MPPPAPPAGPQMLNNMLNQAGNQRGESSISSSTSASPSLEPVTPASILSLGSRAREPTGLMPVTLGTGILDQLPMGPITADQQRLAEVLTTVSSAADAGEDLCGRKGKDNGKCKGKAAMTTGRSAKPSPVIRPTNGTPKTILPSGTFNSRCNDDHATQLMIFSVLQACRSKPQLSLHKRR